MDTSTFINIYESSPEESSTNLAETIEALRRSLDKSHRWFYDVSGNGTEYYCSGARNGVGFAECRVILQDDGMAIVRAVSVPFAPEYERSLAKLCRAWNKSFKLTGLRVRDGRFIFESAPFDPIGGRMKASEAVGLALSTVHAYGGVVLALEAGIDPWDLIDIYDEHGGDDDDDDDGMSIPSSDFSSDPGRGSIRDILRRHLAELAASD